MRRRFIGIFLTLCMLSAAVFSSAFVTKAADLSASGVAASSDLASSSAKGSLPSKVEDGNILHCFNWSLSQIKEELPNIAKAGFTSVQTSPLQPHDGQYNWYWLYQPANSTVGNDLGSYNDLKNLCTEADKYGVKVIVDVVANHLAGSNNGDWANAIDGSWRNGEYFHNQGACSNWDNRYDVTHKNIGMPDLNSEHSEVQNRFASMVSSMKNIGVDGVRWDAAKHIGLPSEGCEFWSKIASVGMYNYGEILDNPAGSSGDDYNNSLMQEYANYIGVTDSSYSGHITGCVRDGRASSNSGNWMNRGVSSNRIVLWGESHDTFCNNGWTNGLSENTIDRSYAVLASRANSQALYFSRPYEQNHDNICYGVKGKTHFTSKEVAAVNHFHNAMVGTKEYYTSENNCFVILREGGAVIVAASGSNFDITVSNHDQFVRSGVYTDEVSGSQWTVDGSNISGHIGDTGIAVIYNEKTQPVTGPSVWATPGTSSFRTDSLRVTLNYSDANSASYSVNGGNFENFYNGQVITIGSNAAYGSAITLTLKAFSDSSSAQETYTYTKLDPNTSQTVYFDNSSYNWSEVYCYMYNDSGSNADWPGKAMTRGSDNIFTYDVPEQFKTAKVLFAESSYSNDHRYPGGGDPGLDINGESMIFGANNSWQVYTGYTPPVVTPTQALETQAPQPTEAFQPTLPADTPSVKVLLGDADEDNSVTIIDVTKIQRHLASLLTLGTKALFCADTDMDQSVTIIDATRIQKHLADLYIEGSRIGQYVEVADPSQNEPVVPSNGVILNASATSSAPEAWYAWTWNDGDGRWVKGDGSVKAIVFKDLDANVIFVRADPEMQIDWNNGSVWNQTNDLVTQHGCIFTTTHWENSRIMGTWSNQA